MGHGIQGEEGTSQDVHNSNSTQLMSPVSSFFRAFLEPRSLPQPHFTNEEYAIKNFLQVMEISKYIQELDQYDLCWFPGATITNYHELSVCL